MSTPTLFTPLKLGSTTIPNRVGMSALTRNRASKTVPNDIMREYYVQRAQGGAGLIVTEGVLITRQGSTRLWAQSHIDGWKQIVDAVHATGSKIYAQLWHLGRVSHPDAPEQIAAGVPVYGPSAISARGGASSASSTESLDMLPPRNCPTQRPSSAEQSLAVYCLASNEPFPSVAVYDPNAASLDLRRCNWGIYPALS
ncbi:glycerol trinitrate reductase protein [Mycena amicta]|nr:glycerol trinitrate reductase protein [Mycena amicta]